MTNEELNDVLVDIKRQCWDSGMNMTGEYQGVWVRFRDIEKIVDGHIKEAAATEHKLETAVNGFFDSFAEMSRKFDETFYRKEDSDADSD